MGIKTNVVQLNRSRKNGDRVVEGYRIKNYVYKHIDFPLPETVYEAVDEILADFWNETPPDRYLMVDDFANALKNLRKHNIILGDLYLRKLCRLIVQGLEKYGCLVRVDTG